MCRRKKQQKFVPCRMLAGGDLMSLPQVHYMRAEPEAISKWHIYRDCGGLGNTSKKVIGFKACALCYDRFMRNHMAR